MVQKPRKGQPRGRSGGRAGGAGYDFQDIYIALQLAKLLVGDRDRPVEVLWEKKALDWGSGAQALHVDDVIINGGNGKKVYIQVKETAPSREWSIAELLRSGVLTQFWKEWSAKSTTDRDATVVRLASGGSVMPLTLLVDVARRARTPSELLSDEGSAEVETDIRAISKALSVDPTDPALLKFIKSIEAEQLPSANELEGWILKCLVAAGENALDLSNRLVRLVSQSKHAGALARSSYTRETLLKALHEDGISDNTLIAIGAIRAKPLTDKALWDEYRASVVENFRSFRVYGLQVERAVYADLAALFVPLRLGPLSTGRSTSKRESDERRIERSLSKMILAESDADERSERDREEETDLATVLAEKRRIAIVGGPGTGKTTTLRWLAIISALPGVEGRETRSKFGLPPEPLVPVYVRFRQFSERFQQRGLHGVEGRVGLVADFLAAQFEGGLLGTAPTRTEGLQMSQEILESERSLLLFDGLDEVADEAIRVRLFEAVADLIQRYKAPRVVVTSRPYAFRADRSPLDLALFEPLPLDRTGRQIFAGQWYRSVRSHLGTAISETQAETLANDLAKTAEALSDLAEIPLLLSILALVHFNRQGLPVERATLYDYATLAMLGHWERDPAGRDLGEDAIPPDWSRKLQLNETGIRRVVECLAYEVQCKEGGGEFERSQAISALAAGFVSSSLRSEYPEAERAELLLRLLVDRSGLVQERDPDIFAFAHLSFQEYLAARWFVGRGEAGLRELAVLAKDERHGEVVRLAVAILASDQRTEADERARGFIMEVATRNAVIAAACLIEVPRLQLEPTVAESLARAVWIECSNMFRRHYHPRVTSRLIWTLLAQTGNADRLLLEFLSDSGEDGFHGKRMMEFESGLFLLRSRPPGPMSRELQWVLTRLAQTRQDDDFPERSNTLADLLLVEAGAVQAADRLQSLIQLLGESRWSRRSGSRAGDAPEDRAEHLLADLLAQESTRDTTVAALRKALGDDTREEAQWRIARLLIGNGESISRPIAEALVRGLGSQLLYDEACVTLEALAKNTSTHQMLLEVLFSGLRSDDKDVRTGCYKVLQNIKATIPTTARYGGETASEQDRIIHLCSLLNHPDTTADTLTALADELWDEDRDTAWIAVRALVESNHTDIPGVPQALVRAGLHSETSRAIASQMIRVARQDSNLQLAIRAALLDGLQSESEHVACASAILLLEMGDAVGEGRIGRVIKACLRDPSQLSEALPYLKRLVEDESTRSIILKLAGEYFGSKPDMQVASSLSRMLAEAGSYQTPNLALGLVVGGLSDLSTHKETISFLRQMLSDVKLGTETRRALVEGLSSKDSRIAWGAARCLLESGSRSDPELPGTLIRVGLKDAGRRDEARAWLLELHSHPGTRKKVRIAFEEAPLGSLRFAGQHTKDYALAWEVALCLLAADAVDTDNFIDALVFGGLARRDRHDQAIPIIKKFLSDPSMEKDLDDAVLKALSSSESDIAWGAARVILETGRSQLGKLHENPDEAGDNSEHGRAPLELKEGTEREISLLRTLLREAGKEGLASEAKRNFAQRAHISRGSRNALVKLLDEKDNLMAYTAACWLFSMGHIDHPGVPLAIVNGGLGDRELSAEASKLLDEMRSDVALAPAVKDALNRALWGTNAPAAWGAAVYLMDRAEMDNPGVARGIVFGGLGHHPREDAERRLGILLADRRCHNAAMDALGAGLFGEYRGERFHVASRLVREGVELNHRIVVELAEAARYWPAAPLSLLALSGRASEARDIAKRLNLLAFVDLIGPSTENGDTL